MAQLDFGANGSEGSYRVLASATSFGSTYATIIHVKHC
jgi:hypothetical protein